jgi:hypothetical protein
MSNLARIFNHSCGDSPLASNDSTTLNDPYEHQDYGQHEKDVNESAQRVCGK